MCEQPKRKKKEENTHTHSFLSLEWSLSCRWMSDRRIGGLDVWYHVDKKKRNAGGASDGGRGVTRTLWSLT